MTTYKVKKGDTLSGIGQTLGVNWKNITGYKSGNPNLISPGEVLNIPSLKSSVKPPTLPVTTNTNTGGSSVVPGNSVTPTNTGNAMKVPPVEEVKPDKFKDFLLNQITQQNKYLNDYINTLKSQPSQADQYKQYSEQLGLPQQQQQVTGIQKQVLDVEGLLSKLEGDINQRTSPFLVTESQRRRKLAAEGTPLRTQLSDLMRSQTRASTGYDSLRQQLADMMSASSSDYQRKIGLAKTPLDYSRENMSSYKEAYQYETPEEKSKREIAQQLSLENAFKQAEVGKYYQKPQTPSVPSEPTSYKEWKLAGSPGKFADWIKKKSTLVVTAKEKEKIEIDRVNNELTDFGKRNYVSQGWYDQMKARSVMSPTDFDNRFNKMILSWRSEERRVGKECRSRWSPYH